MTVLQALPAFEDNYIWCYRGSDGGSIVVDPGDAGPVLAAIADGLRIGAIFITHHHNDHIGGLDALRAVFSGPVYGPEDGRIAGISRIVCHGDVLHIPGFGPFRVLAVPGHTRSHIAYADSSVLFCGDTLFHGGPGATGRSFSDFPTILTSIKDRLGALPSETVVYTGHGDSTKIGDELVHYDEWVARGH